MDEFLWKSRWNWDMYLLCTLICFRYYVSFFLTNSKMVVGFIGGKMLLCIYLATKIVAKNTAKLNLSSQFGKIIAVRHYKSMGSCPTLNLSVLLHKKWQNTVKWCYSRNYGMKTLMNLLKLMLKFCSISSVDVQYHKLWYYI